MLTKREIEVLELRKKGLKQNEIAKKLKISQPAVSLFERNILRKIKDSIQVFKIIKEIGVKYNKSEEEIEFENNSKKP